MPTTMSIGERIRHARKIAEASRKQLEAIIEALGGRDSGWRGFVNSEEVLVYLRDNDPAYMDVSSVGELVERLGIKLDEPVEILNEVRLMEQRSYRTLNE